MAALVLAVVASKLAGELLDWPAAFRAPEMIDRAVRFSAWALCFYLPEGGFQVSLISLCGLGHSA